jgi:uncharacterized zinc-type alcohol dehydrogenase-like protein
MCAGITVYSSLKSYMTQTGQKIGILGIGGLGHLAIQFAHAPGLPRNRNLIIAGEEG